MRVEILVDPKMANRGAQMLDAMIAASPIPVHVSKVYTGKYELLMTYGTGHPLRRPWWVDHIASGRHAIGWDLGYWNRENRTMRLTIDADHPQKLLQPESPDRWARDGIELRSDSKPRGRVVIIGMTAKSNRMTLLGRMRWETREARIAKAKYPDREIVYRPKRDTEPTLPGFKTARGDIADVLRGASLVICRHSNVAVDACIAGVPVQCEDGAAYALYANNPEPTPAQRLEFLRSLAHWQYTPNEAATAWNFILSKLTSAQAHK